MTRIFTPTPMLAFALATIALATTVSAQSVCIPLPRLLTTTPMGGQVGTTVELTITGDNLEEVSELVFTHAGASSKASGITAKPKRDAAGVIEPNKYIVTIPADCPTGLHEARVMSRLGVSSSRMFSV
ncbi:MAG: hypothetical protein IT423_09210, partial [Pirellulaceae bacterium]|nr:hypothetical protein [Pirellulaceae bacterium]